LLKFFDLQHYFYILRLIVKGVNMETLEKSPDLKNEILDTASNQEMLEI